LLSTLRRNPLECWAAEHFEKPIVKVGLPIGHAVLVHAPAAIRHILLANADNYRKDWLQRRVLSAGLNNGLLSAEGKQWQVQRRAVAPMFARRTVMSFAPAMLAAAEALGKRWAALGNGATIDVAAEMSRLTLEVLERTIFSDGLGSNAERFRLAMAAYFKAIGRIGPLDLLGVPAFVPRIGELHARSPQRFFETAIDTMIERRRARLAENPSYAPRDILTLLPDALDPETGTAMTGAEVRSNILTFISAGHETTANSLAWSLFAVARLARARRGRSRARDRLAGRGPCRPPPGHPRGHRGSDPALSANRCDQPCRARRRRHHRRAARTRLAHRHRALCPPPPPAAVGCAGRVRSFPLLRRIPQGDRPLCLSAVRSRPAHLHRIGLRAAGSNPCACNDREPVPPCSAAGTGGATHAAGHATPRWRPADDAQPAPAAPPQAPSQFPEIFTKFLMISLFSVRHSGAFHCLCDAVSPAAGGDAPWQ
jgi:cytochrome P450